MYLVIICLSFIHLPHKIFSSILKYKNPEKHENEKNNAHLFKTN
jgi:hypothetical protein